MSWSKLVDGEAIVQLELPTALADWTHQISKQTASASPSSEHKSRAPREQNL